MVLRLRSARCVWCFPLRSVIQNYVLRFLRFHVIAVDPLSCYSGLPAFIFLQGIVRFHIIAAYPLSYKRIIRFIVFSIFWYYQFPVAISLKRKTAAICMSKSMRN